MDGGTVVTASAGARVMHAEQAVFTSIRSPMGEGYRIVAASRGISPDEKREIVPGAPSHGSLCDSSPRATGLASFALSSGRQCVFLSRNGGTEHTGRGGCRVLTWVLVLEPEVFRRFRCDPFRVEAAVLRETGGELPETSPARMEPILLRAENDRWAAHADRVGIPPPKDDLEQVTQVLSAMLAQRRTLVVGAPSPRAILRLVLGATPAARRQRLSVSYGLKFSPARRYEFVLADASPSEIERIVRDREIDVIRWESRSPPVRSPFRTWLRFVRQRWEAGRIGEVDRLSAELTEDCSPMLLERIARLCEDLERVPTADQSLLRELARRHLNARPTAGVQRRLLSEFHVAAEARRAALEQAEQKAQAEAAKATQRRT
jgi:hypothetical protein